MPLEEIYDASHADYEEHGGLGTPPFGGEYTIGGLIGMAAYALIGYGAFFTYAAAAAAPAVPLTTITITYTTTHPITGATVTGVANYCTNGIVLTAGQQAIIASMQSQGIGGVSPVLVNQILMSWGLTRLLSIDGIIALSLYERALTPGTFPWIGNWMGGNLTGGSQNPPGFPGFPADIVQFNAGGTYGCIMVQDVWECYWYR